MNTRINIPEYAVSEFNKVIKEVVETNFNFVRIRGEISSVRPNKNNHLLSDKYLDVIRYHSFYPWHTSEEYKQFMNDEDQIKLDSVLKFNEFDLYSKEDPIEITKEVKDYYTNLLNEYFLIKNIIFFF